MCCLLLLLVEANGIVCVYQVNVTLLYLPSHAFLRMEHRNQALFAQTNYISYKNFWRTRILEPPVSTSLSLPPFFFFFLDEMKHFVNLNPVWHWRLNEFSVPAEYAKRQMPSTFEISKTNFITTSVKNWFADDLPKLQEHWGFHEMFIFLPLSSYQAATSPANCQGHALRSTILTVKWTSLCVVIYTFFFLFSFVNFLLFFFLEGKTWSGLQQFVASVFNC